MASTSTDHDTSSSDSNKSLGILSDDVLLCILALVEPTDILNFAACNYEHRKFVNTYIVSIAASVSANYDYTHDYSYKNRIYTGETEYMNKIITTAWKFSEKSTLPSGWRLLKILARFKTINDLAFCFAWLTEDKFATDHEDWPPRSNEPGYEIFLQLLRGCVFAFDLIDIYKSVKNNVTSDTKINRIRDYNRVRLLYSRIATEQLQYIKQCHPLEAVGFRLYLCVRACYAWLLEKDDKLEDFPFPVLGPLGYQEFYKEAKAAPAWTAWIALLDSPKDVLHYVRSATEIDCEGIGVYRRFPGMYIGVREAIHRAKKLYRDTPDATIQEQVKTAKATFSAVDTKATRLKLQLKDLLPSMNYNMNDRSETLYRRLGVLWNSFLASDRGQRQFLCRGVNAGEAKLSLDECEVLYEIEEGEFPYGFF